MLQEYPCLKNLSLGCFSVLSTVIFEILTFLIQKHFKTVTVTDNLWEINSNDFQDGNWESMEMKVPQRNCVTKILPNVRVNFLVRFASKPLFYWVMTGNPLELFRKFFGAVRAIFWLCGSFLAPDFWGNKFSRVTRLPVIILTRTVKETEISKFLGKALQGVPQIIFKQCQLVGVALRFLEKLLHGETRNSSTQLDSVREELERDKLNGINGFLRKSAVVCGFLRKSAVFCENLRLRSTLIPRRSESLQKSAKFCEKNCEKTASSARFVPFSLSLWVPLEVLPNMFCFVSQELPQNWKVQLSIPMISAFTIILLPFYQSRCSCFPLSCFMFLILPAIPGLCLWVWGPRQWGTPCQPLNLTSVLHPAWYCVFTPRIWPPSWKHMLWKSANACLW